LIFVSFFFSSRRRHTRFSRDWSSDVCSSDLVGAACHLRREMPETTFTILEKRDAIGGTWDLFRYPGVRSDSDMYTLGYRFRPWTGAKSLADGPSILQYIRDTAAEAGIDKKIRFHHKVVRAEWSSDAARWTVDAE